MAEKNTPWVEPIFDGDTGNKFQLTDNGDGSVQLVHTPTFLNEPTPYNAERMNNIESRLNIDYSLSEQVTGHKNIDGKEIFKRTFRFIAETTANNVVRILTISGIDKIINFEYYCEDQVEPNIWSVYMNSTKEGINARSLLTLSSRTYVFTVYYIKI